MGNQGLLLSCSPLTRPRGFSFALLAPATQAKGKLPCLTVYRVLKVSSISVLSTNKRKLKPYRFPLFMVRSPRN